MHGSPDWRLNPATGVEGVPKAPDHSGREPDRMRAMILDAPGEALREEDVPMLKPESGQVLVRIGACAVCRTDLHVMDGELKQPKLPLILGHEIVGQIAGLGPGATRFKLAS